MADTPDVVLVTGALGNAGWKLACHLARHSSAERLVAVDVVAIKGEHLDTLERIAGERSEPGPRVELREARAPGPSPRLERAS